MAITALDKLINGNDLVTYTDLLKSGLPFASIDQYKGHSYALSNVTDAIVGLIEAGYSNIFLPEGDYAWVNPIDYNSGIAKYVESNNINIISNSGARLYNEFSQVPFIFFKDGSPRVEQMNINFYNSFIYTNFFVSENVSSNVKYNCDINLYNCYLEAQYLQQIFVKNYIRKIYNCTLNLYKLFVFNGKFKSNVYGNIDVRDSNIANKKYNNLSDSDRRLWIDSSWSINTALKGRQSFSVNFNNVKFVDIIPDFNIWFTTIVQSLDGEIQNSPIIHDFTFKNITIFTESGYQEIPMSCLIGERCYFENVKINLHHIVRPSKYNKISLPYINNDAVPQRLNGSYLSPDDALKVMFRCYAPGDAFHSVLNLFDFLRNISPTDEMHQELHFAIPSVKIDSITEDQTEIDFVMSKDQFNLDTADYNSSEILRYGDSTNDKIIISKDTALRYRQKDKTAPIEYSIDFLSPLGTYTETYRRLNINGLKQIWFDGYNILYLNDQNQICLSVSLNQFTQDDQIINKKYVDDIASKKANSTEVTTSIKTAIDNLRSELMGEGVPEAYDTFKELADYIERHQTVADALVAAVGNKVDKIEGKGLSTNDFTTEDKNKLEGIAVGAQVNVIESISVNGVVQTILKKNINIVVPTGELANKSEVSESDLDIDLKNKLSGYAKKTDLDTYTTESEVNTKLENYLPKSGGTMTGALTLKGEPTADLQAATKKYVDDKAPLIIDASSITSMETTNAALNSIGTASKMKREVLLISGTNVYHLNYATDDEVAFVCIDRKKIYTATLCSGDEAVSYDICYVSATQRTITLSSTGWRASGDVYTRTVAVSGVSATETAQEIHVTPATASMTAYMEAGVYASGQASNRITFTASEKPTADLTVYVVIRTL